MIDPILALVLAAALLGLNAFYVAAEFAVTTADRPRLAELAQGGSWAGRMAQKSAKELSLMLAGAQLGITVASIALGFVAEPAVAFLLELAIGRIWELDPATLHLIALPTALALVTALHMVFGEILPKNVALTRPTGVALALAVAFRFFANAVRPIIWVLNGAANLVVRLFGVEPEDEVDIAYSRKDLEFIVADLGAEGQLDEPELEMLERALNFSGLRVREAMTPRPQMVSADVSSTPLQLARMAQRSGYSRFPLWEGDQDNIVGLVDVVDLYRLSARDWGAPLPRPAISQLPAVFENAPAAQLPTLMRSSATEMLLVVDEHGDAAGLVTTEDLAVALVGDLADQSAEDSPDLRQLADGSWSATGLTRASELAQALDLELPEGEFDTVAGFVINQLSAIPDEGAFFAYRGWLVMVVRTSGPRILTVRLMRDPSAAAPAGPDRAVGPG